MTDNKLQPVDLLDALDNADTLANKNAGRKIGRLRDVGIWHFPENAIANERPVFLMTEEEWQAEALRVRDDQDRVMHGKHPEAFSKDSSNGVGVVRKISRA